jgi:hypothetical protein
MNNKSEYKDWEDITTESGAPDEPITVQEAKDFMKLEGFVDVDESTTESISNFTGDDTFIGQLITAARKKAESFCGISIVFHTWRFLFDNGGANVEMVMGPVRTFLYLKDCNDAVIDAGNYKLRGFGFKYLESPCSKNLTATYDAGYEDVPEGIVTGIKQMVYFWYSNRGEDVEVNRVIPDMAIATLTEFKRGWTYVG